MKNPNFKRMQRLTQLLFISGTLNIILLGGLIQNFLREKPPIPYFESKPALSNQQQRPFASHLNNAQLIYYYRQLSQEQLIAKLSEKQLSENGYAKKDMALACLVAFHYFDLERALAKVGQPQEQRPLIYGTLKNGQPAKLILYPGLKEEQYAAILNFIQTEKWLVTPEGLHYFLHAHLKKEKSLNQVDSTLVDAFSMTSEFLMVDRLFKRSPYPIEKEVILDLVSQGPWILLHQFVQQQRVLQDFSAACRQAFLLTYIEHNCPMAAALILKTDRAFATYKLTDAHVLQILTLLTDQVKEEEVFVKALLASPRSSAVWKLAEQKLKPPKIESNRNDQLLLTLAKPTELKSLSLMTSLHHSAIKKPAILSSYVVKEGDSLWKIARSHRVDLDQLRQLNQLQSDFLKPGLSLKIPKN